MSAGDEPSGEGRSAFLDTNVLLYLLSEDRAKADTAQALLRARGTVSVQVLNEFASVATRKLRLGFAEAGELLASIRYFCRVEPVTIETHELGLACCERYGYAVYDSMILAAAMLAGCRTLLSEDMQADQTIMDRLVIRNPFAAPARSGH